MRLPVAVREVKGVLPPTGPLKVTVPVAPAAAVRANAPFTELRKETVPMPPPVIVGGAAVNTTGPLKVTLPAVAVIVELPTLTGPLKVRFPLLDEIVETPRSTGVGF